MKTLGVFGDSYADDSHETGWPTYISSNFDKSYLRGVCGSSAGTAYLKFLEHVDELTHAVFAYSSTHRIPYLPEDIEHFAWYLGGDIDHTDKRREKELKQVLWSWQNVLYNKELNELLCNSIFKSVNDLCEEKGIHLVNIIPFDGYADVMDEYDTAATKFPIIRQLNWLSMMEGGNTSTYQKRMEKSDELCMRPCHLNTP
ncbi:hypothetical protein OAA34_00530, partial [bacterium]|nr:hypothetical protein [bacterium]